MSGKPILVVSDDGNQSYWSSVAQKIKDQVGSLHIVLAKEVSRQHTDHMYDVVLLDVSDIEELYLLIPEIHREQPRSRVIVVSSTPTWAMTREVIRLGASSLIRKSSNLDQIIDELRLL